jgi:MoaA/NifB/PqqE/SkfB family radical SAM enzyme
MENKDWNPYQFNFTHVHLEVSSKCALRCPRCPRTEHPETPWLNQQLSLADVKMILPEWLLSEHVKRVTICGDVGDPIYNTQFIEIVRYIKTVSPSIHLYIITNGSYRKKEWWQDLASQLNECDTVTFSIDGPSHEINSMYRVGSDWTSIMEGMGVIAKSRAFLVWAAILFKFNQDLQEKFMELAKEKGCDYLQITKSTKFGKNYKRFFGSDGIDPLQPDTENISSSLRFERKFYNLSGRRIDNSEFLQKMTDATRDAEKESDKQYVLPLCKTGNRGIYFNTTGQMYPCSWVSFPYIHMKSTRTKKVINFSDSYFLQNADKFNVLKNGLVAVLNNEVWKRFFESINGSKSTFVECEQKCQKEIMNEDYKIGWFLN